VASATAYVLQKDLSEYNRLREKSSTRDGSSELDFALQPVTMGERFAHSSGHTGHDGAEDRKPPRALIAFNAAEISLRR